MTLVTDATFWIVAGIALMIGEMLTGGFFLLFIALGAFAAALAASLGAPLYVEGIICAVVAVAGVMLFRGPLQKRLLNKISIKADLGKEIQLDQAMQPHQQTRITYQGTTWMAVNLEAEPLEKGEHVIIAGLDGNILQIRKHN